ncbi:MAG: ABC transporter permease subunit [Clostridia bacterium]|nr:ABC transporter permease subunit [Clostridia bacterium]
MRPSKARDALALCLGVVLIGCLLQAAGTAKGDALVFPGVGEILRAFWRLLLDGQTWQLIATTLGHVLASMAVATAAGVLLGVAQGLCRFLRMLLSPLMAFLRAIPMIVLIVVVMVLTSYDRVPVIASTLILVPMISEAACEGCLRIDRELIDVYRMNSALNLRVLFRVYLPLMAGYLRQAWINAVGMAVKLAVSTEYLVQTRNSLGKAVHQSAYFFDYQDIYAYALMMILLVLLLSEAPMALLSLFSRRKPKSS